MAALDHPIVGDLFYGRGALKTTGLAPGTGHDGSHLLQPIKDGCALTTVTSTSTSRDGLQAGEAQCCTAALSTQSQLALAGESERLLLHAQELSFIHPSSGDRRSYVAPCPFV
jgi:23S rRNA-/tRNA-specific pseudouridylate synthase